MTLDRPDDYRWIARHGGGALYDIGCYCVSIMRALSGREPVRAAATVRRCTGDVDATLTGLLDFGDGIGGQFVCSYVSAYTQQVTLIGSSGVLTLDAPFASKGRTTRLTLGESERGIRRLRSLCRHGRGVRPRGARRRRMQLRAGMVAAPGAGAGRIARRGGERPSASPLISARNSSVVRCRQ